MRQRGLLGVPYDNHITSTHFPGSKPPSVDGTREKEGGGVDWVPCKQSHTVSLRRSWGARPRVPWLGGLRDSLDSGTRRGFHRPFCILLPTWMGPKEKTRSCFFINDAFCRVRLSTD